MGNRINEIDNFYREVLLPSDSVVISGGGLVGVELAAEIAHRIHKKSPRLEKSVYLISRSNQLLNTMPQPAGKFALQWLEANGVTVLLGDEIQSIEVEEEPAAPDDKKVENKGKIIESYRYNRIVSTKLGKRIKTEVIVDCTGRSPVPLLQTIPRAEFVKGKATRREIDDEEFACPCNANRNVIVDANLRVKPFFPFFLFSCLT